MNPKPQFLFPADDKPIVRYRVTAYTSAHSPSRTEGFLYITLEGAKGSTEPRLLFDEAHVAFQAGSEATFFLEDVEVGAVHRAVLRCDAGSIVGARWQLDYLEVVNSDTGDEHIFSGGVFSDETGWTQTLQEPVVLDS